MCLPPTKSLNVCSACYLNELYVSVYRGEKDCECMNLMYGLHQDVNAVLWTLLVDSLGCMLGALHWALGPPHHAASWTLVGGLIAEEDPLTGMGLETLVIFLNRLDAVYTYGPVYHLLYIHSLDICLCAWWIRPGRGTLNPVFTELCLQDSQWYIVPSTVKDNTRWLKISRGLDTWLGLGDWDAFCACISSVQKLFPGKRNQ